MSKHTPGPWVVGSKSAYGTHNPNLIHSEQDTIAMVYGIPHHTRLEDLTDRWETGLANARLIAAAPDLLEALQWFKANVIDTKDGLDNLNSACKRIEAAIAKATGEQQ